MSSLLDNVAVLHDEDKVGVANGREAMSNYERGTTAGESFESLLNELFGASVDVRGCLVENEHGRVFDHGASDS